MKINDKITVGQKFGELTVLRKLDRKWNNYDVWECLCSCGNISTPCTYTLLKGKTSSCGAHHGYTEKNLKGRKFGKLTVIGKIKGSLWKFSCDCGNFKIARIGCVIKGYTKHCGCDRKADLLGKKFGKLLVVGVKIKNRSQIWECLCDCGNVVYPDTHRLLKLGIDSCGSCTKNDLTGKRFGKLTALKKLNKKNRTCWVWLCKCDCGNFVEAKTASLANGGTTSCGCARLKYTDRTFSAKKRLFSRYKESAKKRNLNFALAFDFFLQLTGSDCFYCKSPPSSVVSEGKINKTKYVYNGIDRVDNTKGYIKENCVPCCKFCNRAKGPLSLKDFVSWAIRAYNHMRV